MQEQFFEVVSGQIEQIRTTQKEAIGKAARLMADAIERGGLIQMFGSGHSQLGGLELFYRAGGLVPVNILYAPCLSVYPHAAWSTYFERQEGLARALLVSEHVEPRDVAILSSVSGRNAVPIEMAEALREKGLKIIVLTSMAYAGRTQSRHPSGKLLHEFGDVVIDLCCAYGDAALRMDGVEDAFAPTSSIAQFTVLEALEAETVALLVKDGVTPPLFMSSNVDGGDSKNAALMDRYRDRIHGF